MIDVAAHRKAMLRHLVGFAGLDAGHARWRAAELERDNPEWWAGLTGALDTELTRRDIKWPEPFVDIPCKLPKLAKGPRALPKRQFFLDTL